MGRNDSSHNDDDTAVPLTALWVAMVTTFSALALAPGCSCDGPANEGEGEGSVAEGEGSAAEGEGSAAEGEGEGVPGALSRDAGCTNGWCWENPRPVGGGLTAVWAVSSNDVWLTTNRHFLHYDGASFQQAPMLTIQGSPLQVDALWGASSNDVWAAANGLLHWDGTSWTVFAEDITDAISVSGVAGNDAWAAGALGVAHWDGVAFSPVPLPQQSSAADVFAFAPGRAVVGGPSGQVFIVDAAQGTATDLAAPASNFFTFAVFATSADDVWAGGLGLNHFVQGTWQPITLDGNGAFIDIWGDAADDVWFAREDGQLTHWDGTNLTSTSAGSNLIGGRISGTSSSDVWISTFIGAALHGGDGVAFTDALAPVTPTFTTVLSIAALPSGEGLATAIGGTGTLLLRRAPDATWSLDTMPTTAEVFGVSATRERSFLFSNSGAFVRAPGASTFTAVPTTFVSAHAACETDNGVEFGAGFGTFVFASGDWVPDTRTANAFFDRIFCVGDDVWGVRGGGGGWAHIEGPTVDRATVFGIAAHGLQAADGYAASPDDARVLLDQGIIMRWNAVRWVQELSVAGLTAIAGRAPNDVWAVGAGGVAEHDDGTGYARIDVPADDALIAVSSGGVRPLAVATNGDVWAFGNTWTLVGSGFDAAVTSTFIREAAFVGDDAYAVGDAQEPLKLVGGTWTLLPSPVTSIVHVGASDAAGAFFMSGQVLQWDDAQQTMTPFAQLSSATPKKLFFPGGGTDIWGIDDFFGALLHLENGRFAIVGDLNDDTDVVFGSSTSDIWVLGRDTSFGGGRADFRIADGQQVRFTDAGPNLAIGASSNAGFVGVDDAGNVWHTSGDWFEKTSPEQSEVLSAAVVVDDSDIWALGETGFVHWDGAQWSLGDSLGATNLGALSLSSGRVYAGVGQGGVLSRRDP